MLAFAKRKNQDLRTFGTLFHACCEELKQATFGEALTLLLMFLKQALATVPEITRDLIQSLIVQFLKEFPPIYGARWLFAWQNNAVCF